MLLEALHTEHAQDAVLRNEGQVDHRGGRLGGATVFEQEGPVLVGRNIFLIFRLHVVDQNGLAVFETPDGKLILVARVAGVRRIALAVLNGQSIFNDILLRAVEAHAEDAGVHDLVDPLIELEQDGLQIEGGGDLLADLAEQLDVLLAVVVRLEGLSLCGGGFGAQFRLAELGSLALPQDQPAALEPVCRVHSGEQQ